MLITTLFRITIAGRRAGDKRKGGGGSAEWRVVGEDDQHEHAAKERRNVDLN